MQQAVRAFGFGLCFGLVLVLGLVLVWFGLVWFVFVWFGLVLFGLVLVLVWFWFPIWVGQLAVGLRSPSFSCLKFAPQSSPR